MNQETLLALFSDCKNTQQKQKQLILLGKKTTAITLAEHESLEQFEVFGCESKVWIKYDGKFQAQSNSRIIQGLLMVVLTFMQQHLEQDSDPTIEDLKHFLKALQLDQFLSLTRQNGLTAIFDRIKSLL